MSASNAISSDPALHDPEQYAALEAYHTSLQRADGPGTIKNATPVQTTVAKPAITFMEALKATAPIIPPNIQFTKNGGLTHVSTLEPMLDLFHSWVAPLPDPKELATLINAAWTVDPTDCLRIIFHSRSIPNGKGERMAFYCALGSVWEKSPRTVLACLEEIVEPRSAKVNKQKDKNKGKEVTGDDPMDGLILTAPTSEIDGAVDEEMDDGVKDEDGDEEDEFLTPGNARSHGFFNDLNVILLLASHGLLSSFTPSSSIESLLCVTDHNVSRSKAQKKAKGSEKKKQWRLEKELKEMHPEAYLALKEKRVKDGLERQAEEIRIARDGKYDKAQEGKQRVEALYAKDLRYRLLHIRIAHIFASHLKSDLEAISSPTSIISLAAKWLPSPKSSLNRDTLITESVARLLFPTESATHALRKLQYTYLTPLRLHTRIPERPLSEKKYQEVHYSRVASKAMHKHKKTFMENDQERFAKYLGDVKTGKKTISGAALTPATFVAEAWKAGMVHGGVVYGLSLANADARAVTDVSWNTLVNSIRNAGGAMGEALAVADVSGSMLGPVFKDGTAPLHSSIGLSLQLATLAPPPFQGTFITFSGQPELVELDLSQGFSANASTMVQSNWEMNTDVVAMFRLILGKAVMVNLEPTQMIKRLFIFSDMEFDACGGNHYNQTHFEMVKREFEAQGYELPELVFWNLGSTTSKPVSADKPGVALVSGYSAALLKVFLDGSDYEEPEAEDEDLVSIAEDGSEGIKPKKTKMDPISIMKKAIGHPSFAGVKAVIE